MLVSILHRATGVGLATGGAMLFTWWLSAIASGPDAYASFSRYVIDSDGTGGLAFATTMVARLAAIALTWAFFQHMATGVRHLVLDLGAGYELKTNRTFSRLTMVASTALTLIVWIWAWRH